MARVVKKLSWASRVDCDDCGGSNTVMVVDLKKSILKCRSCGAEFTLSVKRAVRPRFLAGQLPLCFETDGCAT